MEDLCAIMLFLMGRQDLSGPFNCVAPNPVRNAELAKALGKALGKPTFMPAVPAFLLRTFLGEFGNVVLGGQRAVPRRLTEAGYGFAFPTLAEALDDLLKAVAA
jgi:NAD dependent epimerase/dehydratase family enzyme